MNISKAAYFIFGFLLNLIIFVASVFVIIVLSSLLGLKNEEPYVFTPIGKQILRALNTEGLMPIDEAILAGLLLFIFFKDRQRMFALGAISFPILLVLIFTVLIANSYY